MSSDRHIGQCFYKPQQKTNHTVPLERIFFHECELQRCLETIEKIPEKTGP